MTWFWIEAISFFVVLCFILSLEFIRNVIGVILICAAAFIIFPGVRGIIWVLIAFGMTVANLHHG